MAHFRFHEFFISGANVYLCSSSSSCTGSSDFCDFSYGGSGTCVSCPYGTNCASYLTSSNGIQDCQNKCESAGMYKYFSHYAANSFLKYTKLTLANYFTIFD